MSEIIGGLFGGWIVWHLFVFALALSLFLSPLFIWRYTRRTTKQLETLIDILQRRSTTQSEPIAASKGDVETIVCPACGGKTPFVASAGVQPCARCGQSLEAAGEPKTWQERLGFAEKFV